MAKDPAMPFYVNDFISSPTVQRMALIEQAAYMRLLAFCWASGDCSLPADDEALRELAGVTDPVGWGHPDDIAAGNLNRCRQLRWELIREKFIAHPSSAMRLTNGRLYELWLERQEFRAEKRRAGAAGAAKRWSKSKPRKELSTDSTPIVLPMANGMANDSSSSSSSSSYTPPPPPGHSGLLAPLAVGGGEGDFWEAFEDRLHRLGVSIAAKLTAEMRDSPNAASRCGEVVDHFEAHGGGTDYAAWNVEYLVHRLRTLDPRTLPLVGWARPSEAWQKHSDRIKREHRQAIEQSASEKRRAAAAADHAESDAKYAALELRVGAALDAMSIADVKRFIHAHSADLPAQSMLDLLAMKNNKGHPITTLLVRHPLLELLDKQREETP